MKTVKLLKDLALAGLWIALATASTKPQVQIALGVVATIQLVMVGFSCKSEEAPHIGGGLTSSAATQEAHHGT